MAGRYFHPWEWYLCVVGMGNVWDILDVSGSNVLDISDKQLNHSHRLGQLGTKHRALPDGTTQCIPSLFPCRGLATLSGSMLSCTKSKKEEDEEEQVRASTLPLAAGPAAPEIENLVAHSGGVIKSIVHLSRNRCLA